MSEPRRILLVTGLSGAGKSSILHALEDLGLETVDNPPLTLVADLVARGTRDLAVGIGARTRDFDTTDVLALLSALRGTAGLQPELIYATADDAILQRRYTATRRRHPMAPVGRVADGIAAELSVIAPLREVADWVIDTSDLTSAGLRRMIETRFGAGSDTGLTLSLLSFAFPAGLPREADMVLDVRFLRNPFYDTTLSSRTGLDSDVAAYVRTDPDYQGFLDKTCGLLRLVLPRFVSEGKKYATVAVGCSGGRHRSVTVIEALAQYLQSEGPVIQQDGAPPISGWSIIVTHRELARLREPGMPPNTSASVTLA